MLKLVKFKFQKNEKVFVKNSLFSKEKFIKFLKLGGGRGRLGEFHHIFTHFVVLGLCVFFAI